MLTLLKVCECYETDRNRYYDVLTYQRSSRPTICADTLWHHTTSSICPRFFFIFIYYKMESYAEDYTRRKRIILFADTRTEHDHRRWYFRRRWYIRSGGVWVFVCFLSEYIFVTFNYSTTRYIEQSYLLPQATEAKKHPLWFINKTRYHIPYLRGQGLNSQLWELRSSAYIAKAENRVLCLVPFHRFYMQKSGREFIPFEELFDVKLLKKYVQVELGEVCARNCEGKLDYNVEFVSKFREVENTHKKQGK